MNEELDDTMEVATKEWVTDMLTKHVEDDHFPISFDQIERQLVNATERDKVIGRLVEVLEGKPIIGPSGNVVGREDGLMTTVQESNAMLVKVVERTNGGVTVRQRIVPEWTRNQKITAYGIAAAFVGTTFANLIALFAR